MKSKSLDGGKKMRRVETTKLVAQDVAVRIPATSLPKGSTRDQAEMRAAQLVSLLDVLTLAKDCEHSVIGKSTEGNVLQLARSIADEIRQSLCFIAKEHMHAANDSLRAQQGGVQ